jgi:peroxiredoxin
MVALQTPKVASGWKALDFDLMGTDNKNYRLADVKGEKGLIVMFICNHCPFVKVIASKLQRDMCELQGRGVGVVAIMSNDTESYPEDSFDNMRRFKEHNGFTFPYLIDETQEVAKRYGAICTPDFFGFDASLSLQYRGRLDDSAMQQKPDGDRELFHAMCEVAEKGKVSRKQNPSIGCSIKWKDR